MNLSLADWEHTPLGPVGSWPPILRTTSELVIRSKMAMVIAFGPELRLLFNSAFAEILGPRWRDALGQPMRQVWARAWPQSEPYVQTVLSGEAVLMEDVPVLTQRSDFTETGYFSFAHTPLQEGREVLGLLCVCTETTKSVLAQEKLQKLQSEMIHLARVKAMESMASSLAHELNQPLATITGYAWGAQRLLDSNQPDRDERLQEALAGVSEGAMRAGRIIQRTRARVQKRVSHKERISLESILDDVKTLVGTDVVAGGVELTVASEPGIEIMADAVQIEQVLVNLIRNSCEALEGTTGGRIWVDAGVAEVGMVEIRVGDNGPGIATEAVQRLFEPFSSTKETGLGIGLSVSRTIIEDHHGRLMLKQSDGDGTAFSITLPRA